MNVTSETQEKSTVKLTIELSQEEMAPYLEKSLKHLAEHVELKGFRKGTAPLDVVKKHVGEMRVLEQAAELAVRASLDEAVKDKDIESIGQPYIGVEKLAPDNPFVYTASFPVVPEVKTADPTKAKVEQEKVDIKEEDVKKVIESLRKMRSNEVLVEREAKEGDKVEVDFNVYLDNIPVDGGASKSYPLYLGESSMIPGFEEQVVGMKKDEEKEFKLTFPKEYHSKQLAGKECDFKVKLNNVYEIQLPEVNADFAKEVGEHESVDDLKDAIEKNLHEEKEKESLDKYQRELMETLIEKSTFDDIPDMMMTRETQLMMQELEQNIARQGLKFDDYLQHLNKDRQSLMLEMTPEAAKRIKSALLIRAYAKENKIEATEEEVTAEMKKQEEAAKGNPQMLEYLKTPSYKEYQSNIIRNKKTLEWLKDQVK